jgi:hypothetical protein
MNNKKLINARALREKIEGLYKGVDLTQSDERLLRNERASLQYQDPAFRAEWEAKNQEAIDLKVQDPKWYADLVARNQAMANDSARNQKIADTVSSQWTDPAYKDWRTKIQQEVAKTEKFKEAHAEGIDKREENGWEEKNAEAAKNRRKPIQTPYGRFESKGDAVKAMTAANVVNAGGKLSVWLNTKSTEYYYIET